MEALDTQNNKKRRGGARATIGLGWCVLVLMLGCGAQQEPPGSAANAEPQAAIAKTVNGLIEPSGTQFRAYYGRQIATKTAELAAPEPQFSFQGIIGPLSELDGSSRTVDLAAASDHWFVVNLPLFDGIADRFIKLTWQAGTKGLSGTLWYRGTTTPGSIVEAQYRVKYSGVHPFLGGAWNAEIVAPGTVIGAVQPGGTR